MNIGGCFNQPSIAKARRVARARAATARRATKDSTGHKARTANETKKKMATGASIVAEARRVTKAK